MIDLKDAAAFLRLCETSNLTRTASLCCVSPSTLSRTLNKLEKNLNTKLCIRDKKGVFITPAGRKFELFARRVLAEYADLANVLNQSAESISGSVRVFCSVTACYLFIPRLLNELQFAAPNLEIKLETGDPADALNRLDEKKADLVISALPSEIPAHIQYVDLVTFPLILIAPKKPRFTPPPGNTWEEGELERLPYVIPQKGQLRFETDKWFSAQGIRPRIYAEIAGHEAIVSLTALGFGLSIVPRLVYELSPFKNDVNVLRELPWSNFRVALCSLISKSSDRKIVIVRDTAMRIAPSFSPDLSRRRSEKGSL